MQHPRRPVSGTKIPLVASDNMEPLDCLIIGAGPAGLTGAIYLARFHLKVGVIDGGDSRAALIPMTHNHAGFPAGIAGTELLSRMRRQAVQFGIESHDGVVKKLSREGDIFVAETSDHVFRARSVLLATGVVNNRPPIDDELHHMALQQGLLRYCPICDGYEVTDRRVGVIGAGSHGLEEAIFLRIYSSDVSLITPEGDPDLSPAERDRLRDLGICLVVGPCGPLRVEGSHITVPIPGGELAFDSVYPALGSKIRSDLADQLSARLSADGCIVVDAHQRTSVPGLYAAGDVVRGLDQISHAMGEAGVAATTIRNDLAQFRRFAR